MKPAQPAPGKPQPCPRHGGPVHFGHEDAHINVWSGRPDPEIAPAAARLLEPARIDWGHVTLEVQRDEETELWRRRFLEEEGDIRKLDSLKSPWLRPLRSAARLLQRHVSRPAQ
jgi:hypothetical protein